MAPKYTLSDSDSEQEDTRPSDKVLEQALRAEVGEKYRAKNYEELTVKRVRHAVEEKLGLEPGYFKGTGEWKTRSEEIIKDEFEILRTSAPEQNEEADESTDEIEPAQPPKRSPKIKRQGPNTQKEPRKRQKAQAPASDESDKPSPAKTSSSRKDKQTLSDQSEMDEEEDSGHLHADATKDDSESEMSVVYDEEPKPKPTRKSKSSEGVSKKPVSKKGAAKGKDEDLDPDQAEIKRLQGWLVKCGIRKMWWRELQPYETPKAKIKHLKQMLEDVGMKGRYSLEKARQIRDERELKADLEQIQQGAKQWGAEDEEEDEEDNDGPARPRRAARGRQALAFLDSDGEETD
ncbi:hypothetical protein PDE_01731 [Penicillium oxalicum 114-2]|uniref:Transcriptional regulator n=1 Tax=Penicillium oxalicum (strain 114-2 / CGMCC 5302) TaxID=933388 RepID=S8AXX6_PENO1|nr:hypothetical protein PDE_01731 [Penicillium oxalicum 114-2]